VQRFGKYIFLTPERLDKTENYFNRHGGKIIVIARFVEGLRQANGILSGIIGMHWLKFLGFNALGAVLWVCTWATVGYLAGENIETIYGAFDKYKWYAAAVLVIIAAIVITRRVRAHRRKAAA
jgi:membrane protein DedA with SNARE-associated domain